MPNDIQKIESNDGQIAQTVAGNQILNKNYYTTTENREDYIVTVQNNYNEITNIDEIIEDIYRFLNGIHLYRLKLSFENSDNIKHVKHIKHEVTLYVNDKNNINNSKTKINSFINNLSCGYSYMDNKVYKDEHNTYAYIDRWLNALNDLSIRENAILFTLKKELDQNNLEYHYESGIFRFEEFIQLNIKKSTIESSSWKLLLENYKDVDLRIMTLFLKKTKPKYDEGTNEEPPSYYCLDDLEEFIISNNYPSTLHCDIDGYTPYSFDNIFVIKFQYCQKFLWELLYDCYQHRYFESSP